MRQCIELNSKQQIDKNTMKNNKIKIQPSGLSHRYNLPVDDGINNDLDWVQVSQEVNDLHSMFHNANSH